MTNVFIMAIINKFFALEQRRKLPFKDLFVGEDWVKRT